MRGESLLDGLHRGGHNWMFWLFRMKDFSEKIKFIFQTRMESQQRSSILLCLLCFCFSNFIVFFFFRQDYTHFTRSILVTF